MEEQLLQQIKYYLSGKMTKEEYAELSEGSMILRRTLYNNFL